MSVDNLDFILTCLTLASFALLVLYIVLCVRPKQRFESLPGPAFSSYLLGNLPQVIADSGAFGLKLLSFSLKHGPAYRLMFPGNKLLYVISHPEDVKYICVRHNFPKGKSFVACMNELVPGSLLTLEPHKHRGTRAAIASMFNPRFLPDVKLHLDAESRSLLAHLDTAAETDATVDIDSALTSCLLDVMSRITLGRPLGAQINGGTGSVISTMMLAAFDEVFLNLLWFPLRNVVPLLQQRVLRAHMLKLRTFIASAAADRASRKSTDTGPRALLDVFVDLPNSTPDDVTAHALTFLFAGHDTTSHTLSFLIFEVARHIDIQSKIRAEIDAELSGLTGDEPRVPSPDDVSRLPYCTQVLQETLRLYPAAASGSVRCVDRDSGHLPHCGFPLPKGTHVLMPPMVMHRSPIYWDRPEEFRPARFAPDALRTRRAQERSFFPFSAGPRNCIGNFVARYELLALTALIFGRYDVKLRCKPENVGMFQALVLRPRTKLDDGSFGGLPVSLTRRK